MSAQTKIEWTDRTWNPTRGCSLVSEGCRRCYAMKTAHRFSGPGGPYEGLTELGPDGPRWTGKIRLVPDALDEPLHWRKPQRIFVNSMSDLFHDDVPFEFIDKVFAVMALCPQHTFQILTKRPERMRKYCHRFSVPWSLDDGTELTYGAYGPGPLPNVHLGVSVEDQPTADERIHLLLQTPAAVRFVSYEPALGPVQLDWLGPDGAYWAGLNALTGEHRGGHEHPEQSLWMKAKIDWVIAGGESGAKARPCNIQWIRDVVVQCQTTGVPCFVKQVGSHPVVADYHDVHRDWPTQPGCERLDDGTYRVYLKDGKGGDIEEWPQDLPVREFPK